MTNKIPVIVIFAPTACGKTALAKDFFGKSSLSCFKGMGEVISADSQAVYIGMNLGTAKPSLEEQQDLPHHLINLITPDVQFGAGDFLPLADQKSKEIYERKKIPIVLGGTGFYIRNFLLGLPKTPESNSELRKNLMERAKNEGSLLLYKELQKIDPIYASKINSHDSYRICRALEVYKLTGKTLSSIKVPTELRLQYNFKTIVLTRERQDLYSRIDSRVEKMFEDGLVQEVENLKSQGYGKESPGMKAIGYSEFFEENQDLQSIKEKIKLDSHHYAKKQYTFMKGIPNALTINADDKSSFFEIIKDFFSSLGL